MKYEQAIKLAIACVEKEIHDLAIDANLAELYSATFPHALDAAKKRKLLREAVAALREIPRPMF